MSDIDPEVKSFILTDIDSFEQLEILLLMRQFSDKPWTSRSISLKLHNGEESIRQRLSDLKSKGLVEENTEQPGEFIYKPNSEGLRKKIDKLAASYLERRVAVINLIFSKPLARIQVFADAFKIRKNGGKDE